MHRRSQFWVPGVRLGMARALRALLGGGALLAAPWAQAQELKASGFASLVLGRSQGACQTHALAARYDGSCTRYVVDWGHGGVVTDEWAADVETRAGLQLDWKLSPQWSATVQVSARTLKEQALNLEWAYLSYAISPEWKLQVGRKRIPLYYYSDFQDVGYAYNTVRPSPDVYGWDVVNYNGASLSTSQTLGQWTMRAEVYGGSEKSRKNPYSRLFGDDPPDVSWSGIAGGSVEFNQDWFTTRISYTRTQFSVRDRATGARQTLYDGSTKAQQDFLGLALNGDWDEWQWRSEIGKARRMDAAGYDASFYLATLGRQFGTYTVTVGQSGYRERTNFPADYSPVKLSTTSLALRYEVHKGGALKLQLDRVRDRSAATFSGNARGLHLAYDVVF